MDPYLCKSIAVPIKLLVALKAFGESRAGEQQSKLCERLQQQIIGFAETDRCVRSGQSLPILSLGFGGESQCGMPQKDLFFGLFLVS